MSFDLNSLLPPHIRELKPYVSARDDYPGNDTPAVFLDANELPGPMQGMPSGINRYPGKEAVILKEQIAAVKELESDRVFLGNGSDEIIDLLMRCFARQGQDSIMIFPPAFGMYALRAAANNLKVEEVPLDAGFTIDVRAALAATGPQTRLIFVCHPNNPSGNAQQVETIRRIAREFNGLVVVDEAYIDFCPEKSLLPVLRSHPNLVVLQTFSKAWGLAGARVGMAFASAAITGVLKKAGFPYNVGSPALKLAGEALNRHAEYRLNLIRLRRLRDELGSRLREMPLVEKVYPSDANFLLVKTRDAGLVYRHLAKLGVVVRNRDNEAGCKGCLRITVGSATENERLIRSWEILGKNPQKARRKAAPETAGEGRVQKTEPPRESIIRRKTSETDITLRLNLDGKGEANIQSGIGFLDHMLQQIARHGLIDLEVDARGDLEVDLHHSIEDIGICLGSALKQALGDKAGIERYGFELPMDDSRARVLIDLGGRNYLSWDASFSATEVGGIPASLFRHFFRSLAEAASCNLHVEASGDDDHHQIEAIFKAFARALRMAKSKNTSGIMPSTKGRL